jgi:hypothetical protein
MHGPARQSAHAIRGNLFSMASQAKTEARAKKEAIAAAAVSRGNLTVTPQLACAASSTACRGLLVADKQASDQKEL